MAATKKAARVLGLGGAVGALFAACVEPPPRIASVPESGLSLRVYVFGASAQAARQAFDSAKQTNKGLRIVREGGDGEVLVGLENDSPKCVAPTGLCSFKVAVRIKNADGKVVHASTMNASANAERCADLCDRAINTMVVKVVDAAVAALKAPTDVDAGEPDAGGGLLAEEADAGSTSGSDGGGAMASKAGAAPVKKAAAKAAKGEPPPAAKPDPPICAVGHGTHLPSDEAEKRAAQVEALRRLEILDQDEYDCLRKAYLDRL